MKVPFWMLWRWFLSGFHNKGCTGMDQAIIEHLRPCLAKYIKPKYELVLTHKSLDPDALACTCLGKNYILIPGWETDRSKYPKNAIVLDHAVLDPAHKGAKSAFGSVCSEPSWLIEEINDLDSGDTNIGHINLCDWVSKKSLTYKIIQEGQQVIKKNEKKYDVWEKEIVYHRCGDCIFLQHSKTPEFTSYLTKKYTHIVGAVYHVGPNIGIFRYPGKNTPSFEGLTRLLPNWYSQDWIVSNGTRKVPAKKPPGPGEPNTVKDLLTLLEGTL